MIRPTGTLTLHFQPHARLGQVDAPLPHDISALAAAGRTLFAACDETATVERLVRSSDGDYHQQESIALGDHFALPEGSTGEMDIEGLAIERDFLWITGSHSLKRDKPDLASDDNAKALDELAEIDRNANRYFLGRLPLVVDRGGALFRWRSPIGAGDDRVHSPQDIDHIMDVPYARGVDQAEGVAFVEVGDQRRLLIVHDSPAPERLRGESLVVDPLDLQR